MSTNGSTPSRDAYRTHLLNKQNYQPKRKALRLFDMNVELRQPSLKDVMVARDMDSPAERSAHMIVRYVVIPGTDTPIFEEGDIPTIIDWPFGEDMARLNSAIQELTGLDIDEEKKELQADPLAAGSSS